MLLRFRGFNRLLDADEGLSGGAEESGEEVMETAEPSNELGEEETETAEPSNDKSDAAFAEMRRNLEAAQKRVSELEAQAADYDEALGLWFQGDNKVAQAHAHYEDIPLSEAISNIEQKRSLNSLEKKNKELQDQIDRLTFDNLKAQDLKAIKDAHPEADLKDVEDLGEEFFKYRSTGLDAVTVYNALQMKKGVPPKPIGKVKTSTPQKTGNFTADEVRAMTPEQVKKNFDKIRESMSKW